MWYSLKKGDLVDIVAPSFKKNTQREQEFALAGAKRFLDQLGLKSRYSSDIFGESNLYANSIEYRYTDFCKAMTSEDSKAVWAIHGGAGAGSLLPYLDAYMPKKISNKLFVGFSDTTALHLFLQKRYDYKTLHWETLYRLAIDFSTKESMHIGKCIIFGKTNHISYELYPLNIVAEQSKKIQSQLVGGNLCVIESLIGTPWHINTRNKILFLEEVKERAYAIDRSFTHLLNSNTLLHTKAIVFGDFINTYDESMDNIDRTIIEFTTNIQIPCYRVHKIGHNKDNRPLPLNTNTVIEAVSEKEFYLKVSTGAVTNA